MSYKATNWAYELPLAGPQKFVIVALADMADEVNSCYPGQDRISRMTGLSVATVRRALVKLETAGLISRHHRQGAYGYRVSDRYTLNLAAVVSEFLPLTEPTRQSALKAESPFLPLTQSIPTAHSDRAVEPSVNHQEPSGGEPALFCPKHPKGTTTSCGQCRDARRIHDAWLRANRSQDMPTLIPPRSEAGECAPGEHRWMSDGTCNFCIARGEVAS